MADAPAPRAVAVVGAGIVGVQLALALLREGLEVTLIDADEPGMGTSFGNAGFIAIEEIFPLAHGRVLRALPRMLCDPMGPLSVRWRSLPRLAPWLLRYVRASLGPGAAQRVAALAGLQREAGRAWLDVARDAGLGDLLRGNGALKLYETDAGFAATTAERAAQRAHGIRWEVLSPGALAGRLPELAPRVRHAVSYPDGMHVTSPIAVTRALVECFVRRGGRVRRARVTEILRRDGRVQGLRTDEGREAWSTVVLCAGHRSAALLEPLGYRVPMVAERGYHLECATAEHGIDAPLGFHERGFYATPMLSGLRLAGTTEFVPADRDPPPRWARAELLRAHADALLPGVVQAETGRWMGHRPTLSDFLPVLGTAPGSRGLLLAFGHQHLGLTLSARTAELVAPLAAGAAPSAALAPFGLERFGR